MDPLTMLQLGMTAYGGLKSLMEPTQDPYKWQREKMQQLIGKIEAEFPKLQESYRLREAQQRETMSRKMTDYGATTGMPQNVMAQNIQQGGLQSMRNLNELLGNLDMQKMNVLQSLTGLAGNVPPMPTDTSGQDLFSTGLQMLTSKPAGTEWDWLAKLLGSQTSVGPFKTPDALEQFLTQTGQWNLPKYQ